MLKLVKALYYVTRTTRTYGKRDRKGCFINENVNNINNSLLSISTFILVLAILINQFPSF
jgi:hypothetical protein